MINPGVFFTVIYPQALPYLCDVRNSALTQTRKDFDVVVVNDGCKPEEIKENLKGLNVTILEAEGGFAANRLLGINFARSHGYNFILFCDADDTFTSNRYERTIDEFDKSQADIVVSNLNIVDEQLNINIKDYFNKEIPNERWIDIEFIKNKNLFGMSNTSIRLKACPDNLMIPETPIVDWFLFTFLLQKGLKAKYITDSIVNYRQHSSNMIGINKFDTLNFRRLARLKNNHYKLLLDNGYMQFEEQYQICQSLQSLSEKQIENIINRELEIHSQPLWWQIITK